jgi:hypothetical protein
MKNVLMLLLSILLTSQALAVGPLVVDQSAATRPLKIYGARVDVNAAGNAIASWKTMGDWIKTIAWSAEGDYNFTLKDGVFKEPPHCWGTASAEHVPGGTYVLYRISSSTPSFIKMQTINAAATNADEDFQVFCTGY